MARLRAFDLSVFGVVIIAGIYGGTKFFEPIVIDALKKENALRTDIPIPEYSDDGIPVENEKSLANLKTELNEIYEQSRRERGLEPKSLGSSSNNK
ncbi:hypothetical protein ACO0RG_002035 [Hanseniaspora osmophila]|uniref:Protein ECM19 n=1 Tax=Hanseniaspora osmophila TaxID=56408 RepID=A0A1E5RHG9_9ASCO|nr:Protein ECM19 [Hanseniaspora osmophila]